MIADKLYYEDAYKQTFSTKIIKEAKTDDGQTYIVLEKTAFYPTGGGQPYDTGTIDGIRVVHVEDTDGEIRHFLERPLSDSPHEIVGVIDWTRRFDHMQQHAGQHILSAAFDHLFQYKTVSFHLGNEALTIDLDTESLSEQEAAEAEDLANQIILENRSIETKWVTEAELSNYPLRKQTKVKEDIRLVIIPDYDYNGCGGTHPKTTGEVRAIKILNWEKQKKKIRVQFVCGNRVLKQFGQKQKVLLELTKLLSAPEHEMSSAVSRILLTQKDLERSLEQARESLHLYESKELQQGNETFLDGKFICRTFENRTIQELQKLARFITAEDPQMNVIFVSENEDRLQIVCARGQEGKQNMKSLASEALLLINGKGGGNENYAQGGGEALMSGGQWLKKIVEKIK